MPSSLADLLANVAAPGTWPRAGRPRRRAWRRCSASSPRDGGAGDRGAPAGSQDFAEPVAALPKLPTGGYEQWLQQNKATLDALGVTDYGRASYDHPPARQRWYDEWSGRVAQRTAAVPAAVDPAIAQRQSQDAQALEAIRLFSERGGHGAAPGVIESVDPSDVALIQSGQKKLGEDVPRWWRTSAGSRVGQGSALAA